MHNENNKLHTKFIKRQVLCIPSFLQKGLGDENSTGVELHAVFEGGKKRTHSEPNEQQSKKSEKIMTKSVHFEAAWGSKK